MLPDGFEMDGGGDTYRLRFNGKVIALTTDTGKGARVCLHAPLAHQMRFVACATQGAGVDYLERWACKWASELRKLYSQPPPRS